MDNLDARIPGTSRWEYFYRQGLQQKGGSIIEDIEEIFNSKKSKDLVDLNPPRKNLVDSATDILIDGMLPHEDDSALLHGLSRNALELGGYSKENALKIETAIFLANLHDLSVRYPVIRLALRAISFRENLPLWVTELKEKAAKMFNNNEV